jgi:hypothetical protein
MRIAKLERQLYGPRAERSAQLIDQMELPRSAPLEKAMVAQSELAAMQADHPLQHPRQ